MDKYIIDGVEYSYGEEVEVRDSNSNDWEKEIFVAYIKNAFDGICCVQDRERFKKGICFDVSFWKYIRKLQPTQIKGVTQIHINNPDGSISTYDIAQSLSGRKAKLTLDDGTEYSVVVE